MWYVVGTSVCLMNQWLISDSFLSLLRTRWRVGAEIHKDHVPCSLVCVELALAVGAFL